LRDWLARIERVVVLAEEHALAPVAALSDTAQMMLAF